MSVEIIARAWSRPVERPQGGSRRAPYSASWTSIVSMLRGELAKIGTRQCIVEMAVDEHDIRNDGWLRSTARPSAHGVRLSFESKHGPLCYEGCAWANWEHNVYAIARTLRAQRMIARDGCVKGDQVYRGWKQLPPGGSATAPIQASEFVSVEGAMRFLCSVGDGDTLAILPADLDIVYKAAARKAHPDAGGSDAVMSKVNLARDFVEQHAGAKP